MVSTRFPAVVVLLLCSLSIGSFQRDGWTSRGWLNKNTGPVAWARGMLEPIWSRMGTRANDPWRYVMQIKRLSRPSRAATSVIPDHFDSRIQWPYCPTISEVFEQGKCASCWAVAPTDVMSDRICIRSRGRHIVRLSAGNLLSCCRLCGQGCKGGYPGGAWMHWKRHGIVTGSSHTSEYGCQRYQFIPCYHQRSGMSGSTWNKCPRGDNTVLKCNQTCQASYNRSYQEDLHYAESVYRIPNEVEAIQLEIMEHGPVQANLRVYEDFLNYKSGVYQHRTGKGLEYHAVKIFGWGVAEDGTPYWMATNPWSRIWGEGGFFKILRGSNHAEIEAHIMAGIPKLAKEDTILGPLSDPWPDPKLNEIIQ